MLDQLISHLFATGILRSPESNPDLRAQALELLDSPIRLRSSWTEVMRHLNDHGFEAGELALICRVHLNLLDNCAAFLEALAALSDHFRLPLEKLRSAAAEVKALQDEIRPLHELAIRKPPSLDPEKLLAAQRKHIGEPALEVGEFLRQIQAGEVRL